MGINRLSLGVQSFDDNLLKMLGRAHDSKTALKTIETVSKRFDNFSIDLMCGIPGQTEEIFKNSLQMAIDLGVPHISIYPLTIEYNTVFYKWKAQGKIDDIDEDTQADHMLLAADMLEGAGYDHYEVASYALSGFECKHNLGYWQAKPYLGIGQSATTMTQNSQRRMRVTDNHVEDDLNASQMIAEDCMLAMRTRYGISDKLASKAKENLKDFDSTISYLMDSGLVKKDGNNFVATEKG